MDVTEAFWRGRAVFMTGHTGFKGSWLSLMLARLGAKTTGFATDPPTHPNLFHIAQVARTLLDIRADVTNYAALSDSMQEARPEIIIHMAAQPLVKAGYADPVGTYATNVMGTVNVLEAARHVPSVQVVLVVTTDKCYENRNQPIGYRESDRLGGHDPYSSSKACAELVTSAFRDSFFLDVRDGQRPTSIMSARAGNVIGGGDFAPDRIVPDAFRAFAAGQPLRVRNPRATRPWQHVLDPLYGYLQLIEKAHGAPRAFAQGWNFGPDAASECDVGSLVSRMMSAWGSTASWEPDSGIHQHEADILRLDTSKARRDLGWSSLLDFDEMIDWTAAWYKTYASGADMLSVTMEQLTQYFSRRHVSARNVKDFIHADS